MTLNEKAFQRQVVDAAKLFGWAVYHTQFSKWSEAGWPDLALCRPPRLVLAELKSDSRHAQLSDGQARWLDLLGRCAGVEVYLWRPPVDDILPILRGRHVPSRPIRLSLEQAQTISEVLDDPPERDPDDSEVDAINELRRQILAVLGVKS